VTTVVQAHTQDFDNKTKVDSDHVEEEEHVEESVIAGRDEFAAVLVPLLFKAESGAIINL
jgi:hypothetical protein